MSDLDALARAAREASTPTESAVRRLHAALLAAHPEGGDLASLVRGAGAAEEEEVERLAARLRAAARRRRRWAGPTLGAALLAASVLLAVWGARPRALDQPLVADTPTAMTLTAQLHATVDGEGRLTGVPLAPRLDWRRGSLTLDVQPNAGVDLVVTTPEARVQVVGTVFEVQRTPLGTAVRVSRGEVRVFCTAGPEASLTAGQELTCWPHTLGGLLGRVQTLRSERASAEALQATLDRALRTEGPAALRGELLTHQLRLHRDEGRTAAAAQTARTYLDEAHPARRAEVEAVLDELLSPRSSEQ